MVTVCPSQFATRRTLFHVLVGCGLLMLKVSRLKLPVIWLLVRSEERRVGKECTVFRSLVPCKKKSFINTMKNINHTRSSISDDIRNIIYSSANKRRYIPLIL